MEAYQNAALSPEERAKDLLGKMTLQEKVGQLNQRLYGFRIYERQGEEFTLTEEFKEEVERMGGLGVLYGLYRADPWADKDEKTNIVLELSAKAYNIVQKYVIDHSRLGIPMMMIRADTVLIPDDLNLLPRKSENVNAPSSLPMRLIRLPNTTNAISVPTTIQRTVSQIIDNPYFAAIPPKPTIAEALTNVAPYDNAMITGLALLRPSRNSLLSLVLL